MRSALTILCIILLLVACAPAKTRPLEKPEPPAAILDEVIGDVTVDGKPAKLGMKLAPGMTIATGAASKAGLLLYRGIAVRLGENTTTTVGTLSKNSVRLSQLTGTTWSKILRIAGVEEYTLQTPFTTATVRGTAFAVKVTPEHAVIKVAEGTVAAVQDGETVTVSEEQQIEATSEEISYEEYTTDGWVEQNLVLDEQFVDEVVEEFIAEHSEDYEKTAHELGIPPEKLEEWAEAYVEGEVENLVPETMEELNELPEEEIVEEHITEEPIPEPISDEIPFEQINIAEGHVQEEIPPEEYNQIQEQPLEEHAPMEQQFAEEHKFTAEPNY